MLSLWLCICIRLTVCSRIKEYHFEVTARSWNESKIFCETYYEGLATILTEDDLKSAAYSIPYLIGHSVTSLWIGLNDIDNEGDWRWIDGTACSFNASSGGHHCSDFWGVNEPNNYYDGEDCGAMWYRNIWTINDATCDRELPFLCNIPFQHQYVFDATFRNWFDAETHCNTYYGGMATIQSSNDYTNAIEAIPNGVESAWIGLNDLKEKGVWEWSHGDACAVESNLTHDCSGFWIPGQVKNDRCGEIRYYTDYNSWFINDDKCNQSHGVLCIQSNTAHPTRPPPADMLYKHFALSLEQRTWGNALIYCQQHYDGMAAILSEEDLQLVIHLLPNNVDVVRVRYMWIGINDLEQEGVWRWVNGEKCTLNNDNCTDLWADGEPNDFGDGEEDCGQLKYIESSGEFKMNDAYCEFISPVLCYNNVSTVNPTFYPTAKPVVTATPTPLKRMETTMNLLPSMEESRSDKQASSLSPMSSFDIIALLSIVILLIALLSTIFCLIKFKKMGKEVNKMTDYVRDQKDTQLVQDIEAIATPDCN